MSECSIKITDAVKIYIDNVLHLSIKKDELIGIQSWKTDTMYCIEYTLKSSSILCEYVEKDLWINMLNMLDQSNLYAYY
jgi:hypothetical protein